MASTSYTDSSGQGTGSSFIPDYPQSAFLQQIAQHASDYADQAYSRYDSTFQPLENSLISDSQKFQSPEYQREQGGQAAAGAAQAGEAQRTNSLRDLQAFGIDPSGGRYAELDQAERGRTAATQTGASQMAMRATAQAGRDMRGQAIGIGQKNLDRASQNLQTASNLKYPPLGQTSQNSNGSHSRTQQTDPQQQQGGGGSGGGSGGGNPSNAPASWAGTAGNPGQSVRPGGGGGGGDGGGDGGGGSDPGLQGDQNWGGMDYGGGDAAGPSDWQNQDNSSGNAYDSGNSGDQSGGWNDPANNSGNAYDSGYQDPGPVADSGGDNYAAGGGTIGGINGRPGGAIPTSDSPSSGQQVDDVPIHANAGEFMIPKDVAAWKGQEFFQKLIETSRKARVTAPAHGTTNPAQAQQQGQAENRAMGQ